MYAECSILLSAKFIKNRAFIVTECASLYLNYSSPTSILMCLFNQIDFISLEITFQFPPFVSTLLIMRLPNVSFRVFVLIMIAAAHFQGSISTFLLLTDSELPLYCDVYLSLKLIFFCRAYLANI